MKLESNDIRRKARPRVLKYGIGAFALTGVVAAVAFAQGRLRDETLVLSVSDVVVGTAVEASFAPTVRVEAVVGSADPVIVTAREGGTVAAIERRNGDYVGSGDVILELDNPTLVREVADGQARLIAQLSDLVSSETQIEGQLQAARNAVRDARYRVNESERELARKDGLAGRGFLSAAVMEGLRADRDYASIVLADAVQALGRQENDSRERLARLRSARGSLEALRTAQASRLETLKVRAAAAGRLTGLEVTLGAPVSGSQIIARIEDERRLELVAQVPESRLSDLSIGGRAEADLAGMTVPAVIRGIDPKVAAGQLQIRLAFTQPPPSGVRLGQAIPLQVSLGEARRAIVLPAGAALGPERAFVIEKPGEARAKPVRLGERSGSRVEVLDGIRSGERVILSAPGDTDGASLIRLVR